MRLKDKIAVVTGAASGIGQAIAERFAREGAIVAVTDVNEAGAHRSADSIRASGGRAVPYRLDVARREDAQTVMGRVAAEHGGLDILVNNAGITLIRPFAELSGADWDRVLDVDLKGVFFCAQAAAPLMVRQGSGRIVNISSSAGTGARSNNAAGSPGGSAAYASAKAGVILLTKTLAQELGPHGINVNCVAPGTFVTAISSATRTPEQLAAHLEHRKRTVALGRIGTLEEVAGSVLFMASDDAGYITGHTLYVDGGRFDRM